jgi:thiamine pyrophosphokinase|tara:strand:+ start:5859 stop:6479 length:621 start_codon:yes stop_codon:yes gene_type:complete
MVRVLIIGNSDLPERNLVNDLIDSSDKIIACDGAVERCLDASINVDYVVGDMDSLENTTLAELSKMGIEVQKLDDQNNNDLQKAINFSSEIGADRINIIGVEGGSNQHQFASYWCLFETEVECYIHLSDSIVSMVKNGRVKLSIEKEKEFSIFAIGDCDGVNVSGGKWQLSNEKLTPNSRGLHNLANDETITISCNNGMLLVFRSR